MATGEVAIVTAVELYVGAPAAPALAADGFIVLCHGLTFASAPARAAFEAANPGYHAAMAQEPEALVVEALERFGRIDAVLSNDMPARLEGDRIVLTDLADFAGTVELLLTRPHRFVAAAMIPAGGGRVLMATSGATTRFPHVSPNGNAGYAAARGGANALVRFLAARHGRDNIQVNAIAPFFLYSDLVFPLGPEEPAYRARMTAQVPMRRLGLPEEAGALAAFLLSGRSSFTSGQIVAFSGAGA